MLSMTFWGGNCLDCCSLLPTFRWKRSCGVQTFVCCPANCAANKQPSRSPRIHLPIRIAEREYHLTPNLQMGQKGPIVRPYFLAIGLQLEGLECRVTSFS